MKIHPTPIVAPSLFALGIGCAFAVLPLAAVRAQDAAPAAPTTDQAVPPAPKSAGEANPNSENKDGVPVKPMPGVKSTLTTGEKDFMHKAAAGNAAEAQLGEVALKNAESQEVKDFAQKMVTDHTAANKELLQLASDEGLANFKVEVGPAAKAIYAKMTTIKGSAFDTAYIKHAVADHATVAKEYEKAEKTTKDPGLKAYEEKTLPTVEEHLKMAKELEATKTKAVNS